MDLIECLDAPGFAGYLKKTGNTICGRHPIGTNRLIQLDRKWSMEVNFYLAIHTCRTACAESPGVELLITIIKGLPSINFSPGPFCGS